MKTKILISVMFFSSIISAQSLSEENLTKERKWQVGCNVNTVEPAGDAGFDYLGLSQRAFSNGLKQDKSFCLGVNIDYRIKENLSVGLVARKTNYKIEETRDSRMFSPPSPTGDYSLDTFRVNQSVFSFSLRALRHFNYRKLNFHAGFQITYKNYGMITSNAIYTQWSSANDTMSYMLQHQTEPGGFSAGFGPCTGFYINIFKGLNVGAEFYSAYSYYETGGEVNMLPKNLLNPNYPYKPFISRQEYHGMRFSNIQTSLNISYNF